MSAFYIKELVVTGSGLSDAKITFQKGLNVINGPSNTWKSYIFKCIDYMFGAEKLKEINESKGYDRIYLEIRNFLDDKPITFLRYIGNNEIYYAYSNINNFSNIQNIQLSLIHI